MRCRAVADTTGERCRGHAVKGMDTCAMHTPKAWNPRLDHPVTISRAEVEALLGGGDQLLVDWLTVTLYRRIRLIEHSNLGFMAKMERLMPCEDAVIRLITIRRVLSLCQEAADLLESLDKEDADEQLRRVEATRAPARPPLPLS